MSASATATPAIRLVVGADPGLTGGLVGLRPGSREVAFGVAADQAGAWWARGATGHPAHRFTAAFRALLDKAGVEPAEVLVVVEAQFSKAMEAGNARQVGDQRMIEGVAAGLGCTVRTFDAQSWRARTATGTGDYRKNKRASVDFCRANLPGLNLVLPEARTPHTGLADAGCIAVYGCIKLAEAGR